MSIAEIFDSMDYGQAPESRDLAEDLENLTIVFLKTLKRELLKAHLRSTENGND